MPYIRFMDSRHSTGSKIRILSKPSHEFTSSISSFQQRNDSSYRQGNTVSFREKCNSSDKSNSRILSKPSVSSREKRGRSKTSHKPERSKQLFRIPSLQDGGHSFCERPDSEIRLDDKIRSDRCLFHCANLKKLSEIPTIQMERQKLPISNASIWNFHSPICFHKVNEGSYKFPTSNRHKGCSVLRRHSVDEPIKTNLSIRSTDSSETVRKSWVCYQQNQVSSDSVTRNDISRVYSEFSRNDFVLAKSESSKNSENVHQIQDCTQNFSSKLIRVDRQPNCFNTGNFPCPTSLSTSANDKESGFKTNNELQFPSSSFRGGSERVGLVDSPSHSLEWTNSNVSSTHSDNSNRCEQPGLGRGLPLRQYSDRGSLDGFGEKSAYQCPRVDGCYPRGEVIHERQKQYTCLSTNRQQNEPDVHKQNGGDCFKCLQQDCPRSLDLVPTEGYNSEGRFYTRSTESYSRLGIQTSHRCKQLETQSFNIQGSDESDHDLRHRPICRQNQCSDSEVHELATGSRSDSFRCIASSLESAQRLCFSPILSHCPVSEESQVRESNNSSCNTGLECSTVVHVPSRVINSEPNSVSIIPRYSVVSQRGTTPIDSEQLTSTSRLAYLRRSFQTMEISENVKKLLLSSWGRGTQKSYDSAWNKWVSWCLEREVDPFSAPLTAILEFLAWMFHKGFQYRTVNVHRSALSSILPHIDGQPVGQASLVKKLMRGILRENPPLPKYQEMWDIDIVLKYFLSLSQNSDLDFKDLTKKLAMLLAIAAPKRSSELARLDTRFMLINVEGAKFQLPGLSKTQHDCNSKEIFYCRNSSNSKLCVVDCLQTYLQRTTNFRKEGKLEPNPLLRTMVRPHKGASANTIANWIKNVMSLAGIDTNKFKAHSTRGSSTSKAKQHGVSISEILNMADWTNVSTFKRFYYRQQTDVGDFGKKVLELDNALTDSLVDLNGEAADECG